MLGFIQLLFEMMLLSNVMKTTKLKTLLENICQRNDIHMESVFNEDQVMVCLHTEGR